MMSLALKISFSNEAKTNGDGERCQQPHTATLDNDYLPRPTAGFADIISPILTMNVVLTSTPNPFWMAIPSAESKPGYFPSSPRNQCDNCLILRRRRYLSDSGRDTRVINPAGSLIVHEILSGPDGCSRVDPSGRPPLVVDVGAHIGWFTLLAASYGCRVLAFEPQPHAHPFLNASVVLNGFQRRVRALRAAVSDDTRQRMKLVNRGGWGNWDISELAPEEDPAEGIEVRAPSPSPFSRPALLQGDGDVDRVPVPASVLSGWLSPPILQLRLSLPPSLPPSLSLSLSLTHTRTHARTHTHTHTGTEHHEFHFTVQEGIDAIQDVVRRLFTNI